MDSFTSSICDPSPYHTTIFFNYHQTSNISRTLIDNNIVDYSGVIRASPIDTAATTS